MVKLRLSPVVCLFLSALASAFAQSSYVFQLPGQTGLTTQIYGMGDNDFTRASGPAAGPAGATRIVATPNGSKLYILAPGGVFSSTAALVGIAPVSAITGVANIAEVSPDGKYLLVITDQFYIVNTAANNLAAAANTGVPTGSVPIGLAVSHDSKTAWLLSNTTTGSRVTAVNLTTFETVGSPLNLPSTAFSIHLSSRNLLYVTTNAERLYEIDPISLTLTTSGEIQVPGMAGPLQFTPDGNSAYFLNRTVCSSCSPIFKLNVQSHSVSGWLPANGTPPPSVDLILVAGNSKVFAYSAALTALFDVTATPLALSYPTPSTLGSIPTSSILAAAVSNERPSARYLYLLVSDHSFYRVNLANSGIDGTSSLDPAIGTILSFVPIPASSGATSLFQINPTQSVAPGGSAILAGQVLDGFGRPVFGASGTFSADPGAGITILNPSLVTTAEGFAQTVVTAPLLSGTYPVTLTVGSLSSVFQLVVGSGSVGGSSLISIYAGDGQLLRQTESTIETQRPLTVKVTDAEGNPLANVSVAFGVTEGLGSVATTDVTTDINGLASTNFTSGVLFSFTSFLLTKVTASSAFGSVEFYEVTHDANLNDPHPPNSLIVTPQSQHLTIPQGGFISGGISALTLSGHTAQPIPNVGLRLTDPVDETVPSSIVSCAGTSRGDNTGISRCDVVAACQPNQSLPRDFLAHIRVGEYKSYGLLVTVTNGAPSLLTLVSGNNQTGSPGDSFTLFARVSDGCGVPAAVNGLVWTVLQGAASFSQAQNFSDTSGSVSARVTLGSTSGPVRIQLAGPNLPPVIFNLTTQISVSGIALVSGGGQSVPVNQAFPNPVVFVVRGPNGTLAPAGLTVNFSVTGSATINPASAITNVQGQVQTSVNAGATAGNITVTATFNVFTATATLSSQPPGPQVTNISFKNAASQATGMTPCGLVTVTGVGLAPTIQGVVSGVTAFGPLPYTLAGVSITANGVPAPIQAVSNQNGIQQVNFQAPCELTAGTATVVVTVNGAFTIVTGVPVFDVQPGVFTYAGPNNKLYGAVIRAVDGSYVTPSNLARRGERYYMVVTGLGLVTPATTTNAAGTGSQSVNLPVAVGIADRGVPVLSARYLHLAIGAYLVEFQIPLDAPLGTDQSLAVAALINNGTTYVFGNPVFLPGVAAAP